MPPEIPYFHKDRLLIARTKDSLVSIPNAEIQTTITISPNQYAREVYYLDKIQKIDHHQTEQIQITKLLTFSTKEPFDEDVLYVVEERFILESMFQNQNSNIINYTYIFQDYKSRPSTFIYFVPNIIEELQPSKIFAVIASHKKVPL